MEKLLLQQTAKTPYICFDANNGTFEVAGKCIPEFAIEFFGPIKNWLDRFEQEDVSCPIVVNFKFDYYNTASSKCILDFFTKLKNVSQKVNVTINWYYKEDDDDMLESGRDWEELFRLPFNYIEEICT